MPHPSSAAVPDWVTAMIRRHAALTPLSHDLEDLLHEVIAEILDRNLSRRNRGLSYVTPTDPHFYYAARWALIDVMRRRSRPRELTHDPSTFERLDARGAAIEDTVAARRALVRIRREVQQLDDFDRAVLEGRLAGTTLRELADDLGTNVSRVHRAWKQVQDHLRRKGRQRSIAVARK